MIYEDRKDTIIMATAEEPKQPSTEESEESERQPGLILEDGSINWDCPCLGGMANGPCGIQFREAFSCFHYSTAEPKGSNCVEAFTKMQDCMQRYPEVYGPNDDEEDDKKHGKEDESKISPEDRSSNTPLPEDKEKTTEKVETVEKK